MNNNQDTYTIDNEIFLKEIRTIYIFGEINSALSYSVCAKLKLLDYIDSSKEITIEMNSQGGEVTSGLAIIDTIRFISAPVKIVVCGVAASMAALIVACCDKGRRMALPHSTIIIHQPLGALGMSQVSDIQIYTNNILKTKNILNNLLAKATNHTIEQIENDTDRDYYMNSEEALAYGIIDQIVVTKKG